MNTYSFETINNMIQIINWIICISNNTIMNREAFLNINFLWWWQNLQTLMIKLWLWNQQLNCSKWNPKHKKKVKNLINDAQLNVSLLCILHPVCLQFFILSLSVHCFSIVHISVESWHPWRLELMIAGC